MRNAWSPRLDRGRARDVFRRARALGLQLRVRWSTLSVGLVLVYHLLDDHTGDPESHLVAPHATALFEEHLALLKRHYRCVTASEFAGAVQARRRGQRPPIAITFDDDSPSHARRALPALASAGVRASFFLTGASLGGPSSYWWEDLETVWRRDGPSAGPALSERLGFGSSGVHPPSLKSLAGAIERLPPEGRRAAAGELRRAVAQPSSPVLSPMEIRGLVDAGHEVGFHTRCHHRLTGLDRPELQRAMVEGRDELAAAAGAPVRTIAYPHGRTNATVAAEAGAQGFEAGFSTVARRHLADDDPFGIGRYWPSYGTPALFALEVGQLLAGRWGPERQE